MATVTSDDRASTDPPAAAYRTPSGVMIRGRAEDALAAPLAQEFRGDVQLIFTSPPFPLNRKKRYGNRSGEEYVDWLAEFAPIFRDFLKPNGSLVVEMGNAWEPGRPVMSTLALEALMALLRRGRFDLCQQFICHNPARLPTPAQWVNVDRIRVKDSYTHVWWMAASSRPKANNRNVLTKYSSAMQRLLATQKYNAGSRPSGHEIGPRSFLRDNGGAIPGNVLTFSNTNATDPYLEYCRANDLPPHPARMPPGLPEFFVRFLTEENDLVMDPFAGSNVTGSVAQKLGRRWISIEPDQDYVDGSRGRLDT